MNANEWSVMWARGYADGFGDVLTTVREMAEKDHLYTLAEIVEELKADQANLSPTNGEPQNLSDEWDHGYADGFEAALAHVTSARRQTGTTQGVLASLEQLWDTLTVPEEEEFGSVELDMVLADADQSKQRVASPAKVRQHNQGGVP